MAMTENQKFNHRTKHIGLKYHFIKDVIEDKVVRLQYHPTATNVADMLTKALGGNKLTELRELACLERPNISQIEEEC
jgi:hypothetical protein